MITLDDIRSMATSAVENPYPDHRLEEFLKVCSVDAPYYAFLYHVAKAMEPDLVYDLGTELGRSAKALACGAPESTQIVTVEIIGKVPDTWVRFLNCHENLRVVSGTNANDFLLCESNRAKPVDLCVIDTNHHYETALSEWSLVRPLMRPGGVVCFDDAMHAGPERVLKEIALPKVIFDGVDGPKIHDNNGFAAVLIPRE